MLRLNNAIIRADALYLDGLTILTTLDKECGS